MNVSFLVGGFTLSLIAAFQVLLAHLKQQIMGDSDQDTEKHKKSKQKKDQKDRHPSKPINWRVLLSHEIQRHLPDHKTEATIRYRQLTGADVQDAERTIEYHMAYPDHVPAHFRHYELTEEQIASLHTLLRRGRQAEAYKQYQAMTGVNQFAAYVGLDILEQQILIEEGLTTIRDMTDQPADHVNDDIPESGTMNRKDNTA